VCSLETEGAIVFDIYKLHLLFYPMPLLNGKASSQPGQDAGDGRMDCLSEGMLA